MGVSKRSVWPYRVVSAQPRSSARINRIFGRSDAFSEQRILSEKVATAANNFISGFLELIPG